MNRVEEIEGGCLEYTYRHNRLDVETMRGKSCRGARAVPHTYVHDSGTIRLERILRCQEENEKRQEQTSLLHRVCPGY